MFLYWVRVIILKEETVCVCIYMSKSARKDLGRSSALIQFCAKFNFQYHHHRRSHHIQVYLYKVFSLIFFLARSILIIYEIRLSDKCLFKQFY